MKIYVRTLKYLKYRVFPGWDISLGETNFVVSTKFFQFNTF